MAREGYQDLSEKEKEKKARIKATNNREILLRMKKKNWEYDRKGYKNRPEDKKLRLVKYRKK